MEMPQGKRAVLYIRASTTEQVITLDAQRHQLCAYASALGFVVVAIETDAGESSRTLDRPALQRALALLDNRECDVLVVTKLDRLTRSVRDLGDLCERYFKTADLVSLGEAIDTRSAGGRLVLNVLVSVAQWEREVISERTKTALGELKRQGKRLGRPRSEVGATREEIREMRAAGNSWLEIAAATGSTISKVRTRAH